MSLQELLFEIKYPGFLESRPCLGVDIGSHSAKFIQAASSTRPLRILSCGSEFCEDEAGKVRVKDWVANKKLSKKPAALSLSDEKVENHEFKLPTLPPKELATAIDFEVKKAVASPEFAFHETVVFHSTSGNDVKCTVASKEVVNARFDEAKGFGLNPRFLEPESAALFAVTKLARAGQPLDRVGIIDIGHTSFRLTFVHGGRVSFTRTLYLGLAPICQALTEQGKKTPEELVALFREIKKEGNSEGSNPLVMVAERLLQESIYTLCEEVRRSEFFARDQKNLEEVETLYLCGGGACIPYVVDYLAMHLTEKKVETLDPFKWAKTLPPGVDPLSGPAWSCALGLALRDIL